jgi:hypothetical protein
MPSCPLAWVRHSSKSLSGLHITYSGLRTRSLHACLALICLLAPHRIWYCPHLDASRSPMQQSLRQTSARWDSCHPPPQSIDMAFRLAGMMSIKADTSCQVCWAFGLSDKTVGIWDAATVIILAFLPQMPSWTLVAILMNLNGSHSRKLRPLTTSPLVLWMRDPSSRIAKKLPSPRSSRPLLKKSDQPSHLSSVTLATRLSHDGFSRYHFLWPRAGFWNSR